MRLLHYRMIGAQVDWQTPLELALVGAGENP
jgi:hypothetical protein